MENIIIAIPCYNEALTIGKVIDAAKIAVPEASVLVYDNNSIDNTAEVAKKHGAKVIDSPKQGKGNVVQQIFSEFSDDILVMVDGDDTYPMERSILLINAIRNGADMSIGDRLSGTYKEANSRVFHNFGNRLVRWLVNKRFKSNIPDIMTGFRAFSYNCVKSLDLCYGGFEIETEMTMKAINKELDIVSIPIEYKEREEGSVSKLNTIKDGIKVLTAIFKLSITLRKNTERYNGGVKI